MKRVSSAWIAAKFGPRALPTDPCVRGRHDQCQGAEGGGPIYPGDVYLCRCDCHRGEPS